MKNSFMRASKELQAELKGLRISKRESYEEVIKRIMGNRRKKRK